MLKGLLQVIFGLLLFVMVFYILTFSSWFAATVQLIKGGMVAVLFFMGLGLFLLGLTELKE